MHTQRKRLALFALFLLWMTLLPGRSDASYLDAGSGSYLFQIVLAVSLTGVYFLKTCLRNVSNRLAGLLGRPKRR